MVGWELVSNWQEEEEVERRPVFQGFPVSLIGFVTSFSVAQFNSTSCAAWPEQPAAGAA
jgi:hypothetical protein